MQAIKLQYNKQGLIPAIIQQHDTGEVLMMAWMNKEALEQTLNTKTTWFWSRSRNELWHKGATSGNVQQVNKILYDCDSDCLLVQVDSKGPACHTGAKSCFFRELKQENLIDDEALLVDAVPIDQGVQNGTKSQISKESLKGVKTQIEANVNEIKTEEEGNG
jgi:phosphoribosyl-AMP cyclohydrolase